MKSSKVVFFDMGNTLLHFHYGKTDEEKDIELELFQIALDKMKANSKDAIMVGDNLQNDIEPAQRLGLTGIWFNKNFTINDTHMRPDNEIFKLKELIDLL